MRRGYRKEIHFDEFIKCVYEQRERENREVAGKLTEEMKTAWKVLKLSQQYSQLQKDLLNWQHSLSDNESSLVPLYFMAHSG